MTSARTTTTIAALLALALSGTSAQAWHHHHHRHWGYRYLTVGRTGPAVLPGYHCALGRYWRPSLRVCQGGPYAGERMAVAPESPSRAEPPSRAVAPPAPVDVPPTQSATSGRRVVSTDTKVVGRQRRVTRDGVLVTYEVRTKVTERYPNR